MSAGKGCLPQMSQRVASYKTGLRIKKDHSDSRFRCAVSHADTSGKVAVVQNVHEVVLLTQMIFLIRCEQEKKFLTLNRCLQCSPKQIYSNLSPVEPTSLGWSNFS